MSHITLYPYARNGWDEAKSKPGAAILIRDTPSFYRRLSSHSGKTVSILFPGFP
jgi:hypothetical protein